MNVFSAFKNCPSEVSIENRGDSPAAADAMKLAA
jgi:hypothetical protein